MYNQSIMHKPVSEYDLRLLKVFIAVVEHGGFSAAANELGITRSTISLHMSNLETRMGCKLCHRGRGGFSLTKQGSEVYQGVIKLFESFGEFTALVNTLGQELTGELIILCAEQLDKDKQRKLGAVVRYLNDNYPKLSIVLDNQPISYIEKQLLTDKAHVGLYPAYYDLDGLDYQAVSTEDIYLCCSNEHQFFNLSDDDISEQLLSETPSIHPGVEIDSGGREQLGKLNLAAKSYQFDTRKAMILSGRFIGYLPQSFIQTELDTGEMRVIKPETCKYQFKLSLVNKLKPINPKKIEAIRQAFEFAFI